MRRAIAAVTATVTIFIGACSLDRTVPNGKLSCFKDGDCPDGYECLESAPDRRACFSMVGVREIDAAAPIDTADPSEVAALDDAQTSGGGGNRGTTDGGELGPTA